VFSCGSGSRWYCVYAVKALIQKVYDGSGGICKPSPSVTLFDEYSFPRMFYIDFYQAVIGRTLLSIRIALNSILSIDSYKPTNYREVAYLETVVT